MQCFGETKCGVWLENAAQNAMFLEIHLKKQKKMFWHIFYAILCFDGWSIIFDCMYNDKAYAFKVSHQYTVNYAVTVGLFPGE